jgi:hypothetical protein
MTGFYDVTTTIKNQLILDPFVNTVTEGDIFEVDLSKQTIFPLSHIMVNQTTREGHALRFNVTVMCMDVVDKTKDETTDIFRGNDNEQDVLNTQLAVALRMVEVFDRGANKRIFTLDGDATFEPFTERFENYLAGWSVTFDVVVPNTMTSCDAGAALITCPNATYIVEYADGTPIESGTITSGGSVTVVVPNSPACDSATWTLTDSDGNVLDSGTIPSGGSETIVAPDATVNVNGTLWDTVLSGGTENIIVRQSSGSTQVGSIQGQYFRIDDSNIQNSDGSYNVDVKAEDSLVLPDSQINVNGVDEGDVVSVQTIDVNITDGTNPVTPDAVSLSGNTLTIEVPASGGCNRFPLVTGQTTVYETNDNGTIQFGREAAWLTLSENNPFGNTSRFTDLLGGSTYSDGVSLDWAYRNDADQLVVGWQISDNGSDINWADAIAYCEGLTLATYSDWHLPQDELLNTLKATQYTRALSYPPFNISTNVRWWSSTTPSAIVPTQALLLPSQFYGVPPSAAKTTTSQFRAKAYRVFTYAELGL